MPGKTENNESNRARHSVLRRIFVGSLRLGGSVEKMPNVADPCEEIRGAPNLGALLRTPGLGHALNLHAMECATCQVLARPHWESAMESLSSEQVKGISGLAAEIGRRKNSKISFGEKSTERVSAIDTVRSLAEEARAELGASSCTVYVVDPYWKDEFRLLACPGVKLQETMHGFVTPEPVVSEGAGESFCVDAASAYSEPQRRNNGFAIPQNIPPEVRHLFGDFVTREGVVSSARLSSRRSGAVEVILFVNFGARTFFNATLRKRMRKLLDDIQAYRQGIFEELQLRDAPTVREMLKVMSTTQDLARVGVNEQDLKSYFESVLCAAMDVAGLSPEIGTGTIHLYDPDTHLLSLVAYRGKAEHINRAQVQYADGGVGVISWVALRGRPLIIHDLEHSPFKAIHVTIMKQTQSELAVPMMAGKRLLGVLNLESTKSSFKNRHVRAFAYSANLAAGAVRLYEEGRKNQRLMQLVGRLLDCFLHASNAPEEVEADVAALGRLVSEWLGADGWDMWYYTPKSTPQFCEAFATYSDFDPKTNPRQTGWSTFICRLNQRVWISEIQSPNRFNVLFWNQDERTWKEHAPLVKYAPKRMNEQVILHKATSELGIPIFVRDRCVGVAWAEYRKPCLQPPHKEQMSMALGFAAGAGLIMQWAKLRQAENRSEEQEALRQNCERDLIELTADLCATRELQRTASTS